MFFNVFAFCLGISINWHANFCYFNDLHRSLEKLIEKSGEIPSNFTKLRNCPTWITKIQELPTSSEHNLTYFLLFLLQDSKESEHINLKVLGQDNAVVQFKIKKHTPLRKLMNAYCDRAVSILLYFYLGKFDGQSLRNFYFFKGNFLGGEKIYNWRVGIVFPNEYFLRNVLILRMKNLGMCM